MSSKRIHIYIIVVITVLSIVGCTGCSETKDGTAGDAGLAGFEQRMRVADSLFNGMQFRDAYDMYLQLLESKELEADSEKRLRVLGGNKAGRLGLVRHRGDLVGLAVGHRAGGPDRLALRDARIERCHRLHCRAILANRPPRGNTRAHGRAGAAWTARGAVW